jgi:hypothetical protein
MTALLEGNFGLRPPQSYEDRGSSNEEFAAIYLRHADRFRVQIERVLGPQLAEQLGYQRLTGGYVNGKPQGFGLEITWPAAVNAEVLRLLSSALSQGGSMHEFAGRVNPSPRATDSAGKRRRVVRSQLLVLDRGAALADKLDLGESLAPVPDVDEPDGGLRTLIVRTIKRVRAHLPSVAALSTPDIKWKDIRIESTALDRAVLRRITLPYKEPSSDDEQAVIELEIEAVADELARVRGGDRVTAGVFVVDTLHHVLFDPGSLTFQPGSLTFQPGSLTFQPGSLTFLPGSNFEPGEDAESLAGDGGLMFAPGGVIPQPADEQLQLTDADTDQPGTPSPIIVTLFDTGIDHESAQSETFIDRTIPDPPGGTPDEEPRPDGGAATGAYGHGTFLAGIIAQRAPYARINHESVRNEFNRTDAYEMAADLNDAWPSDIICLSFGIAAKDDKEVEILHDVVKYLHSLGIVIVAAAGNISDLVDEEGNFDPTLKFYPAAFEEVLSVGAIDANGDPAPFAPRADWVDVWSYGVNVLSSFPKGEFHWPHEDGPITFECRARWSGSSMAAPRVAAAIAHAAHERGCSPRDILKEITPTIRSLTGDDIRPRIIA